MNFKKSKQELLNEMQCVADDTFRREFQNMMPYGSKIDENGTLRALQRSTTYAIAAALEVLMENVYTDAEFEEDIGLKDK